MQTRVVASHGKDYSFGEQTIFETFSWHSSMALCVPQETVYIISPIRRGISQRPKSCACGRIQDLSHGMLHLQCFPQGTCELPQHLSIMSLLCY